MFRPRCFPAGARPVLCVCPTGCARYNEGMAADIAPALKVVAHSVVHLRAEPRSGSELVSQTLLGRTVRVLREQDGWSYVESDDTYRGWAETRWLSPPKDEPFRTISAVFSDVREAPTEKSPLLIRLPLLCAVHTGATSANGWTAVTPPGENAVTGYVMGEDLRSMCDVLPDCIASFAAEQGREFRGTPYLWGGSSSFGLDCSGFVQLCYRLAGVLLRRDADIQRDDPRFVPVEAGKQRQPGDLVFFGKPDKITHVGMQLTEDSFIHAAGGAGVIVTRWGASDDRYSASYVDARRLDPARASDAVTRFEAEDR